MYINLHFKLTFKGTLKSPVMLLQTTVLVEKLQKLLFVEIAIGRSNKQVAEVEFLVIF